VFYLDAINISKNSKWYISKWFFWSGVWNSWPEVLCQLLLWLLLWLLLFLLLL